MSSMSIVDDFYSLESWRKCEKVLRSALWMAAMILGYSICFRHVFSSLRKFQLSRYLAHSSSLVPGTCAPPDHFLDKFYCYNVLLSTYISRRMSVHSLLPTAGPHLTSVPAFPFSTSDKLSESISNLSVVTSHGVTRINLT